MFVTLTEAEEFYNSTAKEKNMGYTPTPWGFDGEDTIASQDWDGDGYSIFPIDNNGDCKGYIGCVDFEENAERIVKCVNAHDELVSALQFARSFIQAAHDKYRDDEGYASIIAEDNMKIIDQALTKAGVKP